MRTDARKHDSLSVQFTVGPSIEGGLAMPWHGQHEGTDTRRTHARGGMKQPARQTQQKITISANISLAYKT